VRKADNLPPSCAVVTKSGNLTSGPVTGLIYIFLLKDRRFVTKVCCDPTHTLNIVFGHSNEMFVTQSLLVTVRQNCVNSFVGFARGR